MSLTKEFLIEIKKLNDASDINSPLSKIKDQTIKGITEPVNELFKTVTGIADALQTNALVQKEAEKEPKKVKASKTISMKYCILLQIFLVIF